VYQFDHIQEFNFNTILIYDYNILRETSLIRVRTRIMDPSGIGPFRSNCSIIPKVSIVFSKKNGIIPIGIHFEKFHNTCPEQVFMFVRSYSKLIHLFDEIGPYYLNAASLQTLVKIGIII